MTEAIDALRDLLPMLEDRLALVNDRKYECSVAGFLVIEELSSRIEPAFVLDKAGQEVCFWCGVPLSRPRDHSMCAVRYHSALGAAAEARCRRAGLMVNR